MPCPGVRRRYHQLPEVNHPGTLQLQRRRRGSKVTRRVHQAARLTLDNLRRLQVLLNIKHLDRTH